MRTLWLHRFLSRKTQALRVYALRAGSGFTVAAVSSAGDLRGRETHRNKLRGVETGLQMLVFVGAWIFVCIELGNHDVWIILWLSMYFLGWSYTPWDPLVDLTGCRRLVSYACLSISVCIPVCMYICYYCTSVCLYWGAMDFTIMHSWRYVFVHVKLTRFWLMCKVFTYLGLYVSNNSQLQI